MSLRPVARLHFHWERWSLFRQFLVAAVATLTAGMLGVGWWVSNRMTRGVIDNSAHVAALYLENSVSPMVQELLTGTTLSETAMQQLDELIERTSAKTSIVALKIWRPDGTIAYSKSRKKVGTNFPLSEAFKDALSGKVGVEADNDGDEDDLDESRTAAIEIYAPLWNGDKLFAVSEIYVSSASVATELRNASVLNWLMLGSWIVLTISILFEIVREGSLTIENQRDILTRQIDELKTLLTQNEGLRRELQEKSSAITGIHEQVLQRVSADLHDGPAQLLTFQLLRLNRLAPTIEASSGNAGIEELKRLRAAIAETLKGVRQLSTSLSLPQLENSTLRETLELAVEQHRENTGTNVDTDFDIDDPQLESVLPGVKACTFRLVQEALSNAFRHGGGLGQKVEARWARELTIIISDQGPGFDMQNGGPTGLGILGMRARAEAIGGRFSIVSRPGSGTSVVVQFDRDAIAREG